MQKLSTYSNSIRRAGPLEASSGRGLNFNRRSIFSSSYDDAGFNDEYTTGSLNFHSFSNHFSRQTSSDIAAAAEKHQHQQLSSQSAQRFEVKPRNERVSNTSDFKRRSFDMDDDEMTMTNQQKDRQRDRGEATANHYNQHHQNHNNHQFDDDFENDLDHRQHEQWPKPSAPAAKRSSNMNNNFNRRSHRKAAQLTTNYGIYAADYTNDDDYRNDNDEMENDENDDGIIDISNQVNKINVNNNNALVKPRHSSLGPQKSASMRQQQKQAPAVVPRKKFLDGPMPDSEIRIKSGNNNNHKSNHDEQMLQILKARPNGPIKPPQNNKNAAASNVNSSSINLFTPASSNHQHRSASRMSVNSTDTLTMSGDDDEEGDDEAAAIHPNEDGGKSSRSMSSRGDRRGGDGRGSHSSPSIPVDQLGLHIFDTLKYDTVEFIQTPPPRNYVVHCKLHVAKGVFKGFALYLENYKGYDLPIMKARRRKNVTTVYYYIDALYLNRATNDGKSIEFGRLNSNYTRRSFDLVSKVSASSQKKSLTTFKSQMIPPPPSSSSSSSIQTNSKISKFDSFSENNMSITNGSSNSSFFDNNTSNSLQKNYFDLKFNNNLFNSKNPKEFMLDALVNNERAFEENGGAGSYYDADVISSNDNNDNDNDQQMASNFRRVVSQRISLCNKKPEYDQILKKYRLDFHGRARVASVNNLQIVDENDPNQTIIFQLGKMKKNCYHLDYSYPLCAFQAFGLAVACLSRN